MDKLQRVSQFERIDFFNPSTNPGHPIQEKWIHKQVVKKTGETEDDWVLEEKPVRTESIDIHKSINEEAKTTDLKYLLKQLFQTGDESVLNRREGFYGDVTMFGEGHSLSERKKIDLEAIKKQLPEEFRSLSDEEIAKLTDEDIVNFYQAKIDEIQKKQQEEKSKVEVQEQKGSD